MLTTLPLFYSILVRVQSSNIMVHFGYLTYLGQNLIQLDFHHLENLDLRALSVLNLNCPG